MTVQQLIDKLKTLPPEKIVLVNYEMFAYAGVCDVEEDDADVCLITD